MAYPDTIGGIMAQVLVTESYLDDIADAIRDKNGTENTYTPAQMAQAIEDIVTAEDINPATGVSF